MKSREIARRYAEALLRLAVEEDCIEVLETDYQRVLAEMSEVPDVERFLIHPLVPRANKNALIERVFGDTQEYLRNLFLLLVRNGREGYLSAIYEEFVTLRAEREGVVRVKVATAKTLTPEDRDRLMRRLAEVLGQGVALDETVQAGLLGGARIDVGGRVVDGTLLARLGELRRVLEG